MEIPKRFPCYLLVDWFDAREQLVGQLLTDDQHRLRRPDLLGGERAPREKLIVPDLEVALFGPHQSDALGNLAAVVHRHVVLTELGEGGWRADPLAHVIGVVIADAWAASPR